MTAPVAAPAIEDLGLIGDRRTAALVDRYGRIVWMCLPNFDSPPMFGVLLDSERGGVWSLGPGQPNFAGEQQYEDDTALLTTRWRTPAGELELVDLMIEPDDEGPNRAPGRRIVLRRLRCLAGRVQAVARVRPRPDFGSPPDLRSQHGGWSFGEGPEALTLWASFPLGPSGSDLSGEVELREGQEAWMAGGLGLAPGEWTIAHAEAAFKAAGDHWRDRIRRLIYTGAYGEAVKRAAVTMHLLTYAPTGALVAAPTTSLPEQIGGERNYDYRFAWVRDVSLSLAVLALLGDLKTAERFMDWICGLDSGTDAPLQVLYRIDGGVEAAQVERADVAGYRGSTPVRIGNHAVDQHQIDSLGYFADCAEIYLRRGGHWKDGYSDLIVRLADYTVAHWRDPTNGIWELAEPAQYVVGKIMSWVVLDRAVKLADRIDAGARSSQWRAVMDEIHEEVMTRGWCEARQAFRQRYESDALDASSLLISLMGFLPDRHPRVLANIEALSRDLTAGGLLHRFDPGELPSPSEQGLGEFEGAFLPCCFWLAAAWAKAGEPEKARALVDRVLSGSRTGLLAEEMDGRSDAFLGNMPLLFSHAEFVRAALEISKARPLSAMRLMGGMAVQRIRNIVKGT